MRVNAKHAPLTMDGPGGTPQHAPEHSLEPSILADSAFFAEFSQVNQAEAERRAGQIRREELERLQEEYGDRPISERVYRSRGLGRPRYPDGKRAHARREAVLGAAAGLAGAGVEFSCAELALAIGDQSRNGPRRVRHTVAQLVRAGRWPEAYPPQPKLGGTGA